MGGIASVLASVSKSAGETSVAHMTRGSQLKLLNCVTQEERSRVKEQQDNAYYRMRNLQQQSRGKKDAYYQNRRFSQEVCLLCHMLQVSGAT